MSGGILRKSPKRATTTKNPDILVVIVFELPVTFTSLIPSAFQRQFNPVYHPHFERTSAPGTGAYLSPPDMSVVRLQERERKERPEGLSEAAPHVRG